MRFVGALVLDAGLRTRRLKPIGTPAMQSVHRRRRGVPGRRSCRDRAGSGRRRGLRQRRRRVARRVAGVGRRRSIALGTNALAEPQTKSDLPELLRVLGFATAPGVFLALAGMPAAAPVVLVVVAPWMIAAAVVAVRQALDYRSTARAIAVCVAGAVLSFGSDERRRADLHAEGELMMRILLAVTAIMIGAGAAALIAGSARWEHASRTAVAKLASSTGPARVIDLQESTAGCRRRLRVTSGPCCKTVKRS